MGKATAGQGSLRARLGVAFVALLVSGLFAASSASAFEQVGTFGGVLTPPVEKGVYPEDTQLAGVGAMAVNYTGAGGVPAGTIYAATKLEGAESPIIIARYNPDGSFSEAWEVVREAHEKKEGYTRCGPEGDPAFPNCSARPEGANSADADVEIDQSTGNVYVYDGALTGAGAPQIVVYTPDGSEVISRFGELAAGGKTVAETPTQIHHSGSGGIAVNSAGEVYVFDESSSNDNFYHRLMLFRPQTPGEYEHYVYAGQGQDLAAGFYGETPFPARPIFDSAGNIYTVASDERISEYDLAHPTDPPICSFLFKKGGITAMTVDPVTGEPFFATYKETKVHRLSPCKEGKFLEVETFEALPERDHLFGLAFDPVRIFEPGRPAGVLYGAAPSSVPSIGGKGQPGTSALGYIFVPANETPPEVLSESVSMVTQSSARLEAEVNPKGTPTHYAFQYVSDAAYQANEPSERFAGAGEVPLGGGLIEGSTPIPVGNAASGLRADTEYHFRARAVSRCKPSKPAEECVAFGAEQAFRTYPSGGLGLPDHRAYELVSPAEKHGGQVFPAEPVTSSCGGDECKPGFAFTLFPMQSSLDGDAVVYEGDPFSFDEGAVIENEYIARRGPAGWQTTDLTPPRLESKARGGFLAFKADLSEGLLEQFGVPLVPQGPAEYGNLYLQPTADPPALSPLLQEAPPNRAPGTGFNYLDLLFAGASADFSRIFFSANDVLTEDAEGGPEAKTNLYEWSGGQLRLVNVAPGNATTIPGAVFGSGSLLSGGNIPEVVVSSAISEDGSRAFWSSASGQVYVREDGEATREVNDHVGKFLTASADGAKTLLYDGCLYDVTTEACEDLTQGKGGFRGVAGQSKDLSRIYFVDTAVLTGEEENDHGDKAQAGKGNLYVWHEGTLAFIGTLLDDKGSEGDGRDWALAPVKRTAQASPDGDWLAFVSRLPLTGFDATGPCELVASGPPPEFGPGPCAEVFLYHASTGELRCASCTPSGAPPLGSSTLPRLHSDNGAFAQQRYLTDSGRVFFDSRDSLNPADTNGDVEDVYEYEPKGVGSCEREGGCVSLISAGRFGVDSNFLAADPSGKNVFFTTRDKLIPADKDELIDLYDAREGGGLSPEAGASECQGEACQPAPIVPSRPPLGSLAQRGAGNLGAVKKRCPKGKVGKHGRCVKKHKPKRRRHRRHHNRGGAR
jgi:hypothetical protein